MYIEAERFYGADIEWFVRLADYSVQNALLELSGVSREEIKGSPFRGKIGRFSPELGVVTLELESVSSEDSLELVFFIGTTLWENLPYIAAGLVSANILWRAFQWLRERVGRSKGKGLPVPSKVTLDGVSIGRIEILRIVLDRPGLPPETLDYFGNGMARDRHVR